MSEPSSTTAKDSHTEKQPVPESSSSAEPAEKEDPKGTDVYGTDDQVVEEEPADSRRS